MAKRGLPLLPTTYLTLQLLLACGPAPGSNGATQPSVGSAKATGAIEPLRLEHERPERHHRGRHGDCEEGGRDRGDGCEDHDEPEPCEPGERDHGCGPGPSSFRVGGAVTGLAGSGLVLRNNGADDLPVAASGSFAFATTLPSGAVYDVTVAAQPTGPSQACTVTSGAGVVADAEVTSVAVDCTTTTPPPPPQGGTPDPGFGTGGKVTIDFSGPPPAVLPPLPHR